MFFPFFWLTPLYFRLLKDNPGIFSYFYDTSGRRICYLAPERFCPPSRDGTSEEGIRESLNEENSPFIFRRCVYVCLCVCVCVCVIRSV